MQSIEEVKDGMEPMLCKKYGGEGYARMNFLSKLFKVSTAPEGESYVSYPGGRENWRQVMPPNLSKLKMMEIKNTVAHFCKNHPGCR